MGRKGCTNRHFSDAFKMDVVDDYLQSGVSLRAICKKYSIWSSNLHNWIRIFAPESIELEVTMSKKRDENEEILHLKRLLQQKELELKREKMRADFLDEMIDVAEETFQIPVRKKAGTKQ